MAISTEDVKLVAFASNFQTRVADTPVVFGLTTGDATNLTNAFDPYLSGYNAFVAAREAGTRSKDLTRTKDEAKLALLSILRQLYTQVQANVGVTDANKALLGVHVRKTRNTPVPVPTDVPMLNVISVVGRVLTITLDDGHAKPIGVKSSTLLSYVGATPPDATGGWKIEGTTGKTTFTVTFPPTVAPGATVWLTAFWSNPAGQSGNACDPVSYTFGAANVQNNGSLRIAA